MQTRNVVFTTAAAAVLTFGLGQYSRAHAQGTNEPAPEQTTPWRCDQVGNDGKTTQQQLDAVLAETAADKRLSAATRANVRAAQQDFDTLCDVDAEVGSREASIFAAQLGQRMGRITAAIKSH